MAIAYTEFGHGRATVDGTQLHYRYAGDGEPVLLLHGWPQHSLQWHTVAPLLAERYRVIAPDLPGCGGSGIPVDGRYDKRTLAATIGGLTDQLGIGPVRLVGYDHGAGVAYQYAAARPDQVSQLAFVEYVLPGAGYEKALLPNPGWHTGSNWQLALFTVPDVAEFAFRGRERELLTWFFWHGAANPTAVAREHLDEYVDQIAKPGALRAGIGYYASVWTDLEINSETMKTPLTMPALGVGGRHNAADMVAKAMSAVAADVSTAVISDAGHWVSDENPRELARVLLDFFDRS